MFVTYIIKSDVAVSVMMSSSQGGSEQSLTNNGHEKTADIAKLERYYITTYK